MSGDADIAPVVLRADVREGWTPADVDVIVLDGDPAIHVIAVTERESGGLVTAGFATAQPSTFKVHLEMDETIYVLEGSAEIAVAGQRAVTLGPGDATTLPAGVVARWTVIEPLREFFVLTR